MDSTVPVVLAWSDAIMVSLTRALSDLATFIPKALGALLILLIGWIITGVVEALVTRGLRLMGFNELAKRAELDRFLVRSGVRMEAASVVGQLVHWFLMLTFGVAATNALGLEQVAGVLERIIAYIPSVVVALVVLVLGAVAARFVGRVVRGSVATAKVGDPELFAAGARVAILGFAVLMALDQLQIAPTIIRTLWMAIAGMVALAGGLAFGLGGRDVARRLLEQWYARLAASNSRPSATDLSPRPEWREVTERAAGAGDSAKAA